MIKIELFLLLHVGIRDTFAKNISYQKYGQVPMNNIEGKPKA